MEEQVTQLSGPRKSWLTTKRKILLGMVVYSLICFTLEIVSDSMPTYALSNALWLLEAFGWGFLLLMWCKVDSVERGEKLSSRFTLAIVIFGWFAFVYYMFHSRGFKKGLIGTLYAVLFAVCVLIFDVIVGTIGVVIAALVIGDDFLK